MNINEYSLKANSAERLMLLTLAKIWMTIDTSQGCSKKNEAIAVWLIDTFDKLGVDHQDFNSINKFINNWSNL